MRTDSAAAIHAADHGNASNDGVTRSVSNTERSRHNIDIPTKTALLHIPTNLINAFSAEPGSKLHSTHFIDSCPKLFVKTKLNVNKNDTSTCVIRPYHFQLAVF